MEDTRIITVNVPRDREFRNCPNLDPNGTRYQFEVTLGSPYGHVRWWTNRPVPPNKPSHEILKSAGLEHLNENVKFTYIP